jgi:hypothetical protein
MDVFVGTDSACSLAGIGDPAVGASANLLPGAPPGLGLLLASQSWFLGKIR